MAEEQERLIDAACALDGKIISKVSDRAPAEDDVPEDATEVPGVRRHCAERFPSKRKQDRFNAVRDVQCAT